MVVKKNEEIKSKQYEEDERDEPTNGNVDTTPQPSSSDVIQKENKRLMFEMERLKKENEILSLQLRERNIDLKSKNINMDSIDISFEKAITVLNNSNKVLSDTLQDYERWGYSDCKDYTTINDEIEKGFSKKACDLYERIVSKLITRYITLMGMNEEIKRNVNSIREEMKAR